MTIDTPRAIINTMAPTKQPKNKRKSPYKKRGTGSPWKKGQSGNPLGRPKKGEAFTDLLREVGEKFEKKTKHGKLLYNQALAIKVWDKALDGSPWATQLIYNRIDGLPVSRLEMSGPDKGPMEFTTMTSEERLKRIDELIAQRQAILNKKPKDESAS